MQEDEKRFVISGHCCPIKIALPVMVHPERLAIVLVSGSRYQSVPSGQRVFHG